MGTSKQISSTDNENVNIYLDGCKLSRVHDAKLLGIIIDENLLWKKQVDAICKTCSRNIGVLNKVKLVLSNSAMYQLYCTLFLPYLNYGLLWWGNVNKFYMNKIFRLQKRALRTTLNGSYLCPTKPLFKKYKVLNIFDMYTKEAAMFMYKYKRNILPRSFGGYFTTNQEIHRYSKRKKGDFNFPKRNSKFDPVFYKWTKNLGWSSKQF